MSDLLVITYCLMVLMGFVWVVWAVAGILERLHPAMIAADKRRLHPDDVPLWLAVEASVKLLADFTDTRIHWVRPMKKSETRDWWGMYYGYPERGIEITVRVWDRFDGWSVSRLKCYCLVELIAHEMAHAIVGIRSSHNNRWFDAYAHCLHSCTFLDIRLDLLRSGVKFPPE